MSVKNLAMRIRERIKGRGPGYVTAVAATPGEWQELLEAIQKDLERGKVGLAPITEDYDATE